MRPDRQQLKSAVFFEKGKPPARQPYFGPDAELYLTPEYLRGKKASEPCKASTNAVRVIDGDTIVLWDGSNAGEVFKARGGVLSSTMTRLKIRGSFDREYFFYAVKNLEPILKGQTAGSGIPHVDKEVLGNLTILEFQQPEQSKIAEVLSLLGRAIEHTEALIVKQQRVRSGLMQDLLARGIDDQGDIRSERTHSFQESPLGRIPFEWHVKSLSELVDENITYGIVQAGPHIEGGVPYIRTGDMGGEAINPDQLLRTSKRIANSYKRSTVFSGDIVFALRATVGKVLPISRELEGANLTQGTAKISPKKDVDSQFLLWVLRTEIVMNQIRLQQKGTTFMEITLTDLRNIRVPLPKATKEQTLISERLDASDRLRLDYIEYLNKLRSIKVGLMGDLLMGSRRVTALLNDTPECEAVHA